MSKIFKIVLGLLVVVSMVSASLAVIGFIGKEREYMKRLAVEDKLALTLKEKRNIEKDIETIKSAKDTAEAEIKKFEEKAAELNSKLQEAKQKNDDIGLELNAKKLELSKVKLDLDNERKEKSSISKKLDNIQADYEKIKKEAQKLTNEKISLEKKVTELKEKQSVSLDKIVVSPAEENSPIQSQKPVMQGKILVVNKEYGFIVIDMGQDKFIQKGMRFDVVDGPKSLGKAEIDKVYDTMASATILPGGKISDMKKGNVIIESR
jgi:hypothetical protein